MFQRLCIFRRYQKGGIQISSDKMENGEIRVRLTADRSSYVRTETKDRAGWQNSHYHSEQTEFYLIERGEILFASIDNGEPVVKKYCSGDKFSVDPMVPHNIKMCQNGLIHTIKYGGASDWQGYPELDLYLKKESL